MSMQRNGSYIVYKQSGSFLQEDKLWKFDEKENTTPKRIQIKSE
jgi:hypothetical protein